jgi:hypothetical protein
LCGVYIHFTACILITSLQSKHTSAAVALPIPCTHRLPGNPIGLVLVVDIFLPLILLHNHFHILSDFLAGTRLQIMTLLREAKSSL